MQLAAVLFWEVEVGQNVCLAVVDEPGKLRPFRPQLVSDMAQCLARLCLVEMKAICCSLNRDCFTAKSLRLPNGQTYRNFPIQNGPVFRAQVTSVTCPGPVVLATRPH
jgi:hypothetical protein